MTDTEKIDLILEWADDKEEFDTEFVYKLQDNLKKYGSLTPRQSEALDNIIERWKIE